MKDTFEIQMMSKTTETAWKNISECFQCLEHSDGSSAELKLFQIK